MNPKLTTTPFKSKNPFPNYRLLLDTTSPRLQLPISKGLTSPSQLRPLLHLPPNTRLSHMLSPVQHTLPLEPYPKQLRAVRMVIN